MDGLPAVESAEEIARGKFLKFSRLHWRDAAGAARVWEASDRCDDHGAVLVAAWLKPSDRLVVIRQFRPPARRFVYELPAGLIDRGETPEAAARRELREETGYAAASVNVGPACHTTPGMSGETVHMVLAEIDETAPENAVLRTDFDPSEDIETLLVPRGDLFAFYRGGAEKGCAFDAKLAAYILGLFPG